MFLAHLEVLAEVLVTAPPVEVNHVKTLVTSYLMEVGVTHVVLDTVDWESAITGHCSVSLVLFTDSPPPVLDHLLLLVLDHNVKKEAAPKMEDGEAPKEANAVLSVERLYLPV